MKDYSNKKPVTRIFDLLEQYKSIYAGKKSALGFRSHKVWNSYTSRDYINYSNQLSRGLLSLGLKKGDKVATIILNCPEWNFIDMALLQIGAVQVPIYPSLSEASFRYIFENSDAKVLIVHNKEILDKVGFIAKETDHIEHVFTISKLPGYQCWTDLLEMAERSDHDLDGIKAGISENDLATIIYTSGTTGFPKGVMLSHKNFVSNFLACAEIPDFGPNDKALSFLPLCHVYERMINYLYQYLGMSIYYTRSLDDLGKVIREVKPTVFCAVPRILEKTFDKIYRKGRSLPWIKRNIFLWSLGVAENYKLYRKSPIYLIKLRIAKLLVLRKWKKALGGKLELVVSGGATLSERLSKVFWATGIQIMEGYGLTETSPVIAVSDFRNKGICFGTVGPVLKGVEVKIAEDGELLARGPNLMLGYYKDEQLTKEAIDYEGWFHTGDIAEIIDGRFIKITDRKKEIFKTSGGKYIAPQRVENHFKTSPFIENLIALGENRRFPAAIIVPDFESLQSWATKHHLEFTTNSGLIGLKKVNDRYIEEISNLNKSLDKTEQIKEFRLISDEWTIESGELSPTLKLRRRYIQAKYEKLIDSIYPNS